MRHDYALALRYRPIDADKFAVLSQGLYLEQGELILQRRAHFINLIDNAWENRRTG